MEVEDKTEKFWHIPLLLWCQCVSGIIFEKFYFYLSCKDEYEVDGEVLSVGKKDR